MNGVIYTHKDAKEMIVCYSNVSIHKVCVCVCVCVYFDILISFKELQL